MLLSMRARFTRVDTDENSTKLERSNTSSAVVRMRKQVFRGIEIKLWNQWKLAKGSNEQERDFVSGSEKLPLRRKHI